jgi:homocysteine S-methyltransferase
MIFGNPFEPFLKRNGCVVLDGGLGTSLQAEGVDVEDPLWSARVLLEDLTPLRRVHEGFLDAGADVIATCTYQATLPGLERAGLGPAAARAAIEAAVSVAVEARDAFVRRATRPGPAPLVAASIGPYGAFLADGSEYTGRYDLSMAELYRFHCTRWKILSESGADLLALETIPSLEEATALMQLLQETEGAWAWISFSCRDDEHLADGTPIREAVELVSGQKRIVAVGANCVEPELVPGLIERFAVLTDIPVVVYPNSGESYDPTHKSWAGQRHSSLATGARHWRDLGATCIGGCCRTTYQDIRDLRTALGA